MSDCSVGILGNASRGALEAKSEAAPPAAAREELVPGRVPRRPEPLHPEAANMAGAEG